MFSFYARDDFGRDSDADLLIVLKDAGDRSKPHLELDRVEGMLKPVTDCFDVYGYNLLISPIVLSVE